MSEIAEKIAREVQPDIENAPQLSKARRDDIVAIIDRHLEPAQPAARCSSCEREAAAIEIGKYCGARLDGKDEFYPCEGVIVAAATPPAADVCPHCFGERSLGDCQVTQRLHAEALRKVDIMPAADAEQRAREIAVVINDVLKRRQENRKLRNSVISVNSLESIIRPCIAAALPAPDSER